MNERIAQLRKELGLTQDAFGEKLNLTRNFVWMIEKGTRIPSDRTISDICRTFNVNEEWLRNGTGDMYISSDDKLDAYLARISAGDDYLLKDFIEIYMDLDDLSRKAIKKIMDQMIEKNKERELG